MWTQAVVAPAVAGELDRGGSISAALAVHRSAISRVRVRVTENSRERLCKSSGARQMRARLGVLFRVLF